MSRLPLKSLNTALILGLMIAAPAQAGSLYFDGNNDSIVVSDFIELGGPITLEAWVRVETATNAGRLISNRNFGGYDFSIWDPDGNSNLELNLSLNGGLEILAPLPRSILGTWIHVAWTWEGPVDGTMKLFLNGSEIASSVRNTTVDPTQGTFRIGSMGWSASAFNFHGSIDEVRVWSTAVDPQTLAAWYGVPLTAAHPDFASLEGYWDFEEGNGQTAATLVNSPGRDGTLGTTTAAETSDPTWQSDTPLPVKAATWGRIKADQDR